RARGRPADHRPARPDPDSSRGRGHPDRRRSAVRPRRHAEEPRASGHGGLLAACGVPVVRAALRRAAREGSVAAGVALGLARPAAAAGLCRGPVCAAGRVYFAGMNVAPRHLVRPMPRLAGYAVSLAALLVAIALRGLLDPVMGNTLPLVTLFGAV